LWRPGLPQVVFSGSEEPLKRLALILFLLATSASAQDLMTWTSTGNDLIALCKKGDTERVSYTSMMYQANCMGYILGVVESHPNLCTPEGVTQTQVVKMVYAYTDKNPKHLNERANMSSTSLSLMGSALVQ
jgi:hypothetical protein